MSRRTGSLLVGLLALPATAMASDFTPLFTLFVELPIFALSVLFLMLAFGAPKAGLAASILLLIGSLFVFGWASEGYLDGGGGSGMLLLSLFVDVAAILVAVNKIKATKGAEPSEDA